MNEMQRTNYDHASVETRPITSSVSSFGLKDIPVMDAKDFVLG